MNEPENLQAVQQLYEAMDQNNIPGILNQLTEDVSWYGLILEGSWQAEVQRTRNKLLPFWSLPFKLWNVNGYLKPFSPKAIA